MKKLAIFMLAAIALLCLLPTLANCQKEEKQKLKYDTLTKTLTRERTIIVSEVIDTARLHSEDSRLSIEIELLQVRRDSIRSQIKTASKLMRGKKGGGGNNRAADTPTMPAATKPTPTTTKPKKTKKQ